ncbi:methylase [Candidatus Nomurabacteria bacterium RIFCSPLOWO2_01_FULL_42_17]|uniref:site-specific DNA-methyltransferase (adenine-specific) n=1 Tax=Candidatus Nomurabacteria bacterium RIFCSPLOWO2_01_FULL_42_17 TaxID=1801780 RepID=A0A1F6XNE3_9BACT|nr:MAG: methylase [Candidatus Nomurabacteria bacterium RIFCSPLOWO2_01_FULL_42_17]
MMISLNEIKNRALNFSKEWERDYNEDAEAKSFWDGFFDVFGVSRRRVASFEWPVKKLDNKQGYIDVLWKGVMLAEHKSKNKDLDKAYTQAKDYFPGLKDVELPRFIIVSDFAKIRLYDLEKNLAQEFELKELSRNVDLFDFISGHKSVVDYGKEEKASIEAAELMAEFHNEIAKTGYSGHDLEVFLVRILFCLFADDTDIFSKHSFRNYIENRTQIDGSDLGPKIAQVFQILNTPMEKRQSNLDEGLAVFPYVNGGIFSEKIEIVSCDANALIRLIKCCGFDWSGISASIFGSLFQGVMNEDERRQLGAHYTSELNILKVINSLFLDELYIEFDSVRYEPKKLEVFHTKLSELKFLDPACGCGNFLVVAYMEIRKLELEILIQKERNGEFMLIPTEDMSIINVNQFYGIEIEEFPALIARVAIYLVDHQMNNELSKYFGKIYARIPLREPASIVNADALITDWESVVPKNKLSYILGNPPFVGARLMGKGQKEIFLKVFDNEKGTGNLDFVTAWYEKASRYMVGTKIKTAFVSTNSICQGEQVGILWKRLKEKYGVIIHFAHQTFKWNNDAPGVAAVYCIIVGFACFDTPKKYLYEYEDIKAEPKEKEVKNINAYLVAGDDVFIENTRTPTCDAPEIVFGSMPNDGGNFLFTEEEKNQFLNEEPNAEKYIKELISAREYLNGEKRYCLWLKDIDPSILKKLPKVLERIDNVRKLRSESNRKETKDLAKTPALFGEIRQPKSDYIFIPLTSSEHREYIPMGFFDKEKISNNTGSLVTDATLYHFGILESEMHMTWVRYVCGRLKGDYRYSNTLVYNNFPWPKNVKDEQKKKVEDCAQKVLDVRLQFSNSSLSDLYDPNTMPSDLVEAHNNLNRAVDVCYRSKFKDLEERIEFLFELYKKYIK